MNFKAYDKTEVFEREMKPLIDKAFEIAKEHEIGFVALAQYMSNPTADGAEFGIAQTVCLHGPDMTNPALVVASSAIQNPTAALAGAMLLIAQNGGTRNDDRQTMLKDGTEAELDGVNGPVTSLLGHISAK